MRAREGKMRIREGKMRVREDETRIWENEMRVREGKEHTSRVFQDMTVPKIVGTILDEHIRDNPIIGATFSYRFEHGEDRGPSKYDERKNRKTSGSNSRWATLEIAKGLSALSILTTARKSAAYLMRRTRLPSIIRRATAPSVLKLFWTRKMQSITRSSNPAAGTQPTSPPMQSGCELSERSAFSSPPYLQLTKSPRRRTNPRRPCDKARSSAGEPPGAGWQAWPFPVFAAPALRFVLSPWFWSDVSRVAWRLMLLSIPLTKNWKSLQNGKYAERPTN